MPRLGPAGALASPPCFHRARTGCIDSLQRRYLRCDWIGELTADPTIRVVVRASLVFARAMACSTTLANRNARNPLPSPVIQTTVTVAWLATGRHSSRSNLVRVFLRRAQ